MSSELRHADYIAFIDLTLPNGFARHARHVAGFLRSNGIETAFLSYDAGNGPALSNVLRLFLRAIARVLSNNGFVVLSTQANYLQIFLAIAARLRGRPLIYDMQDLTPESFLHLYGRTLPGVFKYAFAAWLRFSERVICALSDVVLVVSPGMRDIVSRRVQGGANIILFPNRHSFEDSKTGSRSTVPTIVYAGGLQPIYRGIETQIQALQRLPRWSMVIAGEGEGAWIVDFAKRHDVAARVQLRGFISPAEVRELLATGHILVIEGVPYGLPSKFFEAVGAGLVVVSPEAAHDVNAILGSDAIIFDGSPESLQPALERAWTNRDNISNRQKRRLEEFVRDLDRESALLAAYLQSVGSSYRPQEVLRQKH